MVWELLALLRVDRRFSVFLVTQGISNLGDAVRNVVIPLAVLQLSHSPALVAAVALLEAAPSLVLQLPFGALVDRWDRRRTLLLTDLARGLVTLLIPAAALAHGPVLVLLFAAALPLGALSCLFSAGFAAITPGLVGRDRVDQAYALVEGAESLAWVAGPLVAGGLTVTVGSINALIVDGASFLLSALGLWAVSGPPPSAAAGRGPLWADLVAGLRFVLTNRELRRVQLAWTGYGAIGYGVVLGLVTVGSRAGSAGLAGLAVAAYAGGSLLGTLLAGVRRPRSPWRAISACLVCLAAGAALIAAGVPATILGGSLLFGLGEGFFLVVYLGQRAGATPDELMGRVNSVASLLATLAGAVAVGWMGLALQWLGGPAAFGVLAVLALALAAATMRTRERPPGHRGPLSREGEVRPPDR